MGYVLIVLFFARAALGMELIHDRFGTRLSVPVSRIVLLAAAGLVLIKGYALLLEPWISELFTGERNTERFDAVRGDRSVLISLIAFSWVIVFFEELAFRVVLFRLLIKSIGSGPWALACALLIQAVVFGLVHLYQGSTAIVGASISGLIYGCLVLAARGSLWAAFLAHGLNNTVSFWLLYQQDA